MKSVKVYVEGVSDKLAMTALLEPLILHKGSQGVTIEFFEAPKGDKKASVIRKVPIVAVNILRNDPHAIVIAMPDLYPLNKEKPHENVAELQAVIQTEFNLALKHKGLEDDQRYQERFKVFCFKYDLEVLVLAAEPALKAHLQLENLDITWHIPVEDQNNNHPPKYIVRELFEKHARHYVETNDTPIILGRSKYQDIANVCPQCFKPFVDFLENTQA